MNESHVRIGDYSDRELLAIVFDLGGYEYVTVRAVGLRLFGIKDLEENEKEIGHAARCVTIRFSWMKRFGLMEKGEERGEWRISEQGRAIREAKLSASLTSGVEKAKEEQGLELAHLVGERLVSAKTVTGRAMQRELQFQLTRRKQSRWYK